jgi:RND family efflux transporter MFP subunit
LFVEMTQPTSINGRFEFPWEPSELLQSAGASQRSVLKRIVCCMLLLGGSSSVFAQAPQAPQVTVSTPLVQDVTEWLEYTGQFAAVDYVEIRSRVSGFLTELQFKDGQMVKKGDLLLVIDPRPYEIELQQAEAQRDSAAAQLEYSTRDVSRGAALRQSDTLAASSYEQRVQQMKTSAAALNAANAAIRQAQLDLEFSHVTSPIAGRVGNHQVSVGNLVIGSASTTNQTLLTTIVSLDPVLFNFDMSESDFLAYQRAINEGHLGSPREHGTMAQVRLDDEQEWKRTGQIDFVDNQIDRGSGTIRVRATFPNSDLLITPGQFGRLRLPISEPHSALLIPDAAVTTDQSRKVVMTVDAEGKVIPKPVQLGPIVDGLRVIRSGLDPADKVVIDGFARARAGTKVTPQMGQITISQN